MKDIFHTSPELTPPFPFRFLNQEMELDGIAYGIENGNLLIFVRKLIREYDKEALVFSIIQI